MEFTRLFSPFVYLYVGGEVCKGFADKASLMPFRHSETHDIIQCVRVFGDVMVKVANKYIAQIIASVGAVFVLSAHHSLQGDLATYTANFPACPRSS